MEALQAWGEQVLFPWLIQVWPMAATAGVFVLVLWLLQPGDDRED